MSQLLNPTNRKRVLFFLACDYLVFTASMYGAFVIRFDGDIPPKYWGAIAAFLLIAIGPKFIANAAFRLYRLTWRYVGARDMINVGLATIVGTLAWGTLAYLLGGNFGLPSLPRSILPIDFLLTLIGVGGVRMGRRIHQVLTSRDHNEDSVRVLLVGGGHSGEQLVRELLYSRRGYKVVGVIDDDPVKFGNYLHGVHIRGGRDQMPRIIAEEKVNEVIVAMPSASGAVIREVVVAARTAGVQGIRILPSVEAMLEGRITLSSVREVNVEDLLMREPVNIDMGPVGSYLYGTTVLITGAAGSVGAELSRQISQFEPGRMVLFEKDETRLFGLELDLRRTAPRVPVFPVVGDVRNRDRLRQVFGTFRPQLVFHAAAYKHVPMMESHPQEAVSANILGTAAMAEAAAESGSESFVLISTDKAVNPTSVMGASKRVAEMIVHRFDESSATRFVAVRFGNVLGSRGSLLPILEEQIRRGGPITVTDPSMERFVMTVTEAARLILRAASLGRGGEVFTLDMGDPVRVVDLAEALIRLSGLEPDVDVPIQFTGARPGEKMKEEIVLAEAGTVATVEEKIFVAGIGAEPDPDSLERNLTLLSEAAAEGNPARIRALLQETVSTYHPAPGAVTDETLADLLEVPADED
ncbi:MAG: nucleoside-diphosphate sugar epimerase/dehydratase [Actinomycetota bacterium]